MKQPLFVFPRKLLVEILKILLVVKVSQRNVLRALTFTMI